MPAARYAELHCRSNFSFLEGASHPEELVERGRELGLAGLALTDRDGVYGAVRFSKAAKPAELPAIFGAELTLDVPEMRPKRRSAPTPARVARLPAARLLAENESGYANLAHAISPAQLRGRKRDARLRLDDFAGRTDGLIALSGVAARLRRRSAAARRRRRPRANAPRAARDLSRPLLSRTAAPLTPRRRALVLAQLRLAEELDVPYVATNGVAYARPEDALLCDVLTCMKYKTDLVRGRHAAASQRRVLPQEPRSNGAHLRAYPKALANTLAIAERCRFRLEKLAGQFPLFPIPPSESSTHSYLRTLVYRGAKKRYGRPLPTKVERQLEYELGIIARMDLAGYFLVVWDIAHKAEELGVLAQGRGSAANSAVCYALGITAVDPVGMNLLFERFLSEERNEIPDIDIDFAHQDREKVIQYVYERYGREHAAMTAEVITYRTRSAIRDVGKALGLSLAQVDEIVERIRRARIARRRPSASTKPSDANACPLRSLRRRDFDAGSQHPRLARRSRFRKARRLRRLQREGFRTRIPSRACAVRSAAKIGALLLALCRRIDGFPRHMGIHSGGMVITRDPLVHVAPVEWATMRDRTIVQWDKDDLSDLGLIKIDLLGLGMLSLLRDAFALYKRRYGESEPPLSLASIPVDDKADLRDAAARRFDRRLPGRVARAAVDAAAPETGLFLRHRDAGRDHPAGSDSRRHDPSVFAPAQRPGAGDLSASEAQADARTHAGRPAVSRTGDAHGDGGRRLFGG